MKRTTLSMAVAGAVALAATVDASIISINFTESAGHANQQMATGTTAGIGPYIANNWNNTAGGGGNVASLTDSDGIITTAHVAWLSSNMWGDGSANGDADAGIGDAQLARGYLDDGAPGVAISMVGIPYAEYAVVLYLSSDYATEFGSWTANGIPTGGTAPGTAHTYQNPMWDASNTMVVSGLSGNLSIVGSARNASTRGAITGVQVVQIPEPGTFGMIAVFGGGLVLIRRKMRR